MLAFIGFVFLSIITLGIYPLYYYVTHKRENLRLLRQIRDKE